MGSHLSTTLHEQTKSGSKQSRSRRRRATVNAEARESRGDRRQKRRDAHTRDDRASSRQRQTAKDSDHSEHSDHSESIEFFNASDGDSSDGESSVGAGQEQTNIEMSDDERANIIWQAGRERQFPGLCQICSSIIGWFFLEPRTWRRVTAGSRFKSIRDVSDTAPDDGCPLCTFLKRLAFGLSKSELVGMVPKIYQFRATTTNTAFNPTGRAVPRDDSPLFCVTSTGSTFNANDILYYNGYFAPPVLQGFDGISARSIGPYIDLAAVRKWIGFCDHQHQEYNCHPDQSTSVPYLLVIDCRRRQRRLVEVAPQTTISYVTLSYVWGPDPCDSLDANGRLPRRLPELIEGAISVTLALGYRYLWIDRYCVPQDDGPRKLSLINSMDKIYEQSSLTIIAAGAKSPKDGLEGVTRPRRMKQESIVVGSLVLSQLFTNIRQEVEKSHWNTRGWTYQEGLLARRRLIFTETQCSFQCGQQWFLETMDYPLQMSFDFSSLPHVFPERARQDRTPPEFASRAQEYSRRQLSKASDAVPAFTGILNRFQFLGHMAGIPIFDPSMVFSDFKGTLLTGLAWFFFTDDWSDLQSSTALPQRRCGVPSWTWCAWACHSTPYRPEWDWACANLNRQRYDFAATTSIAIEDAQGKNVEWSLTNVNMGAYMKAIMALGDMRFLRVRGWICDISVPDLAFDSTTRAPNPFRPYRWGPYIFYEHDLQRLNAIAKKHRLQSVGGAYQFKGWIVSLQKDQDRPGYREKGYIILLGNVAESNDVERVDLCTVSLDTMPNLSSKKGFVPELGWQLRTFRMA